MARTKVFDPAQALEAAMDVFWNQGYEATSLDDLLSAMKIGRQSMYDTFGDKKQLYLATLGHYADTGREVLRRRLSAGPSALGAIGAFLQEVARSDAGQRERGCLAVNAVAEFGKGDPEVFAFTERTQRMTEQIFAEALARARDQHELADGVDLDAAAHFIHTAIRGMRISAKAGASAAQLDATAAFIMAALKAPAAVNG
jgi:TetR/AcrR family transcriptional regulator, transcriptional repressor for nem operon